MYYKPDYITNNEKDSVLSKRNSFADIPFLICKIIIILIFVFDKEIESEHWAIIIFLSLLTGFNTYCNLFIKNHSNMIIKRFNNFFSLTLFWSFMTLLILKIFENFKFDGGLYLFSLGIIINILFCFCFNENNTNFLAVNFNNISSSVDSLNYIKQYLKIVEEKDISRNSLLIFNSFIEKAEEKCTNKRCVLKNYLESLSKGIHSKFLLLLYSEKLFKLAISKFPQDIILKINYVIFLYTKINKKKEAKTELIQIKPKFFSFNDNFNLYICQKYIEDYFLLINEKNKEKVETFNMIQALEYKNHFNEFKKCITKSSGLYYDFWSSLYNCHLQGTEDISKLNEIGNKINKLIEKIDKIYLKLNEIKNNDYEVIKLYESFIKNILNNKNKYKKYHNISMNLVNTFTEKTKEIDYTNFDIDILKESDENNYLLISTDEDNKGLIINMSLGACSIFGYHKNELIGKNMNILIPELFQKLHERVYNDITEKIKTEFYDKLVNKIIYKPQFTEIYAHAKNKSRYIIPLLLKVYLVQTEENELVFIVEINRNNSYKGELDDIFIKNNEYENICCILTDDNLKIKTFSSNCVDVLKLNSNIINSNYEITSFIRQLNDDFIANLTLSNKEFTEFEVSDITNDENLTSKINEINNNQKLNVYSTINKSLESTLKNKKKLIKTKFLCPRKITWKIENTDKASVLYSEKYENKTFTLLLNDNNFENENKYEQNFLMTVREAYILNKHVGYYFYFKKLKISYNKNKSLRLSKKLKRKKNSLFKDVNVEEILSYTNKKEDKPTKIKNYRASFSHKNILLFPENNKNNIEQKKNSNELFDLENSNIKSYEYENIIKDNYIPQCNFNFILDLDSFSYKPSNIIQSSLELIENLKNQANSKIKFLEKQTKKKTSSSNFSNSKSSTSKENSSSEDSSSILYSYDMNSSQNDNKKDELQLSRNYLGNKNINKNTNNYFEQYYKVNIKNIKFIIYDFNREKFVENLKEEKKSQIENLLENYKLNKNIHINEDDNYPNYSHLNYSKDKVNNKNIQNDKSIALDNKSQSQNIIKYEKEKDFEKEIIDSLAKKDEQKAIIQFYVAIIICTTLFLIMNVLEILYINTSYRKISENMKLLINSINLKYYNNFDIYFLRELLLSHLIFTNFTNNITYNNYPLKNINKRSDYSKDIYEFSNNSFYQSHSLIELIFSSELTLSKNASYIINEMPYFSETLINSTFIKRMESSLSVAIIYVYSFFCNILTDINDINIKNPESFNFIHNAINNMGKALKLLNELFLSELKKRESYIIKNLIFIICANSIIYIIIYFINNMSYFKVVNKKMSYLTVFYEIKLPSIKSSIKKCETFINKINKEDKKFERIGKIKESSINSYSLSNTDSNSLTLNKEEIKSIIDYKSEEKNNAEKKVGIDKKYNYFQILFIICIIVSFLYLCLVILIYSFLIENFIFIGEYIIHMQNYHNNLIELFNAYREFLYEENTIIFDMPSYEYLIYKEKEIYSSNTGDIKFLNAKNNYFENIIKELNKIKICDLYINDYFINKQQCQNYFGGKEGIINLDFELLINYFVEEIRMKRNKVYKLIKNKLLVGNLTDLNDQQFWNDEYLNLKNKSLIFRLEIFNKEEIHNRLNSMYIHIIYQYINKERNLTINEITNIINNRHINCIILIACHCIIVIIIIMLYWVPKIKVMNIEIYKTKNMLSIIPVQILASLPNIKKLLNISIKK